jgi:hypothetical protein
MIGVFGGERGIVLQNPNKPYSIELLVTKLLKFGSNFVTTFATTKN